MAHERQNPIPKSSERRVMILCFDGTWNKFSQNSNVVRLFSALQKGDSTRQIVYYQPGIGTVTYNTRSSYNKNSYSKRTFTITHMPNTLASAVDAAIASSLDDHVKDGYRFIAQNYRPGDRICIFGFSRGAHTARVVAGMVYKVGITPKDSVQLVDFAYSIYSTTGDKGYKLSQVFKQTFTPVSVSVDFVGVWDTVSSVGFIPEVPPYTSVNYAVKTFRHALSLDERRARFHPDVWCEITLERSHELDVDIPVPDIPQTDKSNRDDFAYNPTERDFADVKEVWFAGTHAGVGGGSDIVTSSNTPSLIPLRWMIKECILNKTGVIFDLKYLKDNLDFDFAALLKEIGNETENIVQYDDLKTYCDVQLKEKEGDHETEYITNGANHTEDGPKPRLKTCCNAQLKEKEGDHETEYTTTDTNHTEDGPKPRLLSLQQLGPRFWKLLGYWWWILEVIPVLCSYQDYHGNWIRRRMPNCGRGRYIPVCKNKVLVHSSVKERIEKRGKRQDRTSLGEKLSALFDILMDRDSEEYKYTPSAYNWDYLQQQNVIEYVD